MSRTGLIVRRVAIAAAVGALGVLWGGRVLPGPGAAPTSFVAAAYARIGRPATPVSVAGVARRTTRRTVVATAPYRRD